MTYVARLKIPHSHLLLQLWLRAWREHVKTALEMRRLRYKAGFVSFSQWKIFQFKWLWAVALLWLPLMGLQQLTEALNLGGRSQTTETNLNEIFLERVYPNREILASSIHVVPKPIWGSILCETQMEKFSWMLTRTFLSNESRAAVNCCKSTPNVQKQCFTDEIKVIQVWINVRMKYHYSSGSRRLAGLFAHY